MSEENTKIKKWHELEMERLLGVHSGEVDVSAGLPVLENPQVPGVVEFGKLTRQLDMKRLIRESRAHGKTNLVMATNGLQLRWQELYYRIYGEIYPVSGRERGTLRNLAKQNLQGALVAGMVAIFWDFVKDDWHRSKHMTPSLLVFLNHFDAWKARGLAIQRYLGFKSKDFWYVINEANIDLKLLESEQETVLRVVDLKGSLRVFVVRNQVLVQKKLEGCDG